MTQAAQPRAALHRIIGRPALFCSLGEKLHSSVPVATPFVADPDDRGLSGARTPDVFVALSPLGMAQPFKAAVRSRQDRTLAGACDKTNTYTSDLGRDHDLLLNPCQLDLGGGARADGRRLDVQVSMAPERYSRAGLPVLTARSRGSHRATTERYSQRASSLCRPHSCRIHVPDAPPTTSFWDLTIRISCSRQDPELNPTTSRAAQ